MDCVGYLVPVGYRDSLLGYLVTVGYIKRFPPRRLYFLVPSERAIPSIESRKQLNALLFYGQFFLYAVGPSAPVHAEVDSLW